MAEDLVVNSLIRVGVTTGFQFQKNVVTNIQTTFILDEFDPSENSGGLRLNRFHCLYHDQLSLNGYTYLAHYCNKFR